MAIKSGTQEITLPIVHNNYSYPNSKGPLITFRDFVHSNLAVSLRGALFFTSINLEHSLVCRKHEMLDPTNESYLP